MTQEEYEQKKREYWEEFRKEHPEISCKSLLRNFVDFIFDRAYALGKTYCAEAEAEGEMLCVSRKRVQEIYSYNEEILSLDPNHSGAILLKKKLTDLFRRQVSAG